MSNVICTGNISRCTLVRIQAASVKPTFGYIYLANKLK